MLKNNRKLFLFYALFSTLGGALTLLSMSAFQKFLIGAPLFNFKGYLVPLIFGSSVGFVIGILYYRVVKSNRELRNNHDKLLSEMQIREKAEAAKSKLLMALEESPVMVVIADKDGLIEYINPKVTEVTGYTPEDMLGNSPCILSRCGLNSLDYDNIWSLVKSGGEYKGEVQNQKKNGTIYWESVTIAPLMSGDELESFVIIKEDITSSKKTQEAMKFRAYHDLLTGIKNRLSLMELLKNLDSSTDDEYTAAMFFINIDNFKDINDSKGHEVGDKVLQIMAKRLMGHVGNRDRVFRWGGDEFAVLYFAKTDEEICRFADATLDVLSKPIKVENYEVYVTNSIGIATSRETDGAMNLIKNAALALNSIKKSGKRAYRFYEDSLKEKIARRVEIENQLHYAIENNEFVLHYQPKIDSEGKRLKGCEALIRWNSKRMGFLSPMEFIPIAESSGFISNIGLWVIREACENYKSCVSKGYDIGRVAINISTLHFKKGDFAEQLKKIVEETGLSFDKIEVEITETALMENLKNVANNLHILSDLGVKISIDDFGTGYSSLAYLKQLPIDSIKIDRSFVMNINEDKNSASIVKAIISIAETMNLEVIAEGIETEEQAEFLKSIGCNVHQGYLYSKPLPKEELEKVICNYE